MESNHRSRPYERQSSTNTPGKLRTPSSAASSGQFPTHANTPSTHGGRADSFWGSHWLLRSPSWRSPTTTDSPTRSPKRIKRRARDSNPYGCDTAHFSKVARQTVSDYPPMQGSLSRAKISTHTWWARQIDRRRCRLRDINRRCVNASRMLYDRRFMAYAR